MQNIVSKRNDNLTISCGSGTQTPLKNWLVLNTCWCRGINSPMNKQTLLITCIHSHIIWTAGVMCVSYPEFSWWDTAGLHRICPAIKEHQRAALRTHTLLPRRPLVGRTACLLLAVLELCTTASLHNPCNNHTDPLEKSELLDKWKVGGRECVVCVYGLYVYTHWGSWQSQSRRVWWLDVWWWEYFQASRLCGYTKNTHFWITLRVS